MSLRRKRIGPRVPRADAPDALLLRPRLGEPSDRVPFKAATPASSHRCARLLPDGSQCSRWAITYHHWLPQEQIRLYVERVARWTPEDGRRRLLSQLLNDPRNLSPFCVNCHYSSEPVQPRWRQFRPFARAEVPESAFAFAAELGLVDFMDRTYPE